MGKLFPKVFLWMFIGLLVSFLSASFVLANPNMLYNIFNTSLYWFIFIAEFLVVIVLSAQIYKMKPMTAKIMFLLYSVLTGVSLSMIGVLFSISSIIWVFCFTAVLFAVFGLIGLFTKIDLTKLGTFLIMALIGVIVVSIVNLFLGNSFMNLILWSVGILIFVGFTAYDIQKIKRMGETYGENDNLAILGALELYLDFINIFVRLINLFGKSKN